VAERAEIVVSGKDQTAAAFASAQRNLASMRKQADLTIASFTKMTAGIGALGLVTAGIGAALNPKPVIDYADQLNKLSQRTGISVESLSALDYQAKLADVSTEELAAGLKRLNQNIAAAARGEKEQADAFKAIGVAVTDAAGNVRAADEVLGDIAERFSGYADGANKVAIANGVGGKSFEKLIPLLNAGRDGMREARTELEKFGGVIGTKLAQDAERFNDNMTRLGVASNALKVSLAGGLLDRLGDLSEKMVAAARDGGLLEYSVQRLKDVLSGRATREFVFGPSIDPDALKAAQQNLAATTAQVERLQAELAANPESDATLKELVRVEETARKAADQVAALQRARAGDLDPRREKDRSPATKPDAPGLPNKDAERDAEALLRKQLDGRIKAIQEAAAEEADLFEFQNAQLAAQFSAGAISIDAFYDQKARAQQDFLDVQQQLFDREIADLRAFQAKLTKPQEREDVENRIADVLARQSKAYREAGQAAQEAEQQRKRATEDFRRSLVELDAQIAELSGDRFGAELLRNAERLNEAQRLLARGGVDDQARVTALQNALRLQTDFAKLQEDIGRASERANIAEEAFLIRAQREGLSRADTEQQILRIREGSIAQLDRLIAQAEELAGKTKDDSVLLYLEQLRLARERAFDAKDPGLIRFNELATEAGRSAADAFTDAVLEGEKFSEVLDRLDKQLTRLVFEDLVTKPLADNITNLIKGVGAQGQGGGAERLFSGIGNAIGGAFGGGQQAAPAGQQQTQAQQAAFDAFIQKLTGGGAADAAGSAALASTKSAEAAATTAATAALGAFTAALAAATAAAGGEAASDVFSGVGGAVLSSIFHAGGVVGEPAPMRAVRYHSGGVAGLAPDEVPAILRRGEEVLTAADPRHRDNAGQQPPSGMRMRDIIINVPQTASRETAGQLAARMARQVAIEGGRNN
jgi:hypothetical protein